MSRYSLVYDFLSELTSLLVPEGQGCPNFSHEGVKGAQLVMRCPVLVQFQYSSGPGSVQFKSGFSLVSLQI